MLDIALEAHEQVRIHGTTYDLANFEMFGLRQRQEVKKLIGRVTALEAVTDPTPDDETEYGDRLLELCRIALPKAPAAVLESLNVGQRGDVAGAFFVPLLDRPGMQLLARVRRSPLASSSPGSNGSTAASP